MRELLYTLRQYAIWPILLLPLGCDRTPPSSATTSAKTPQADSQHADTAPPTNALASNSQEADEAAEATVEHSAHESISPKVDQSIEFFEAGQIPELRIRLTAKEEKQLRADQRRYVDCTLTEDGTTTYKKVKVKLKGAAGSFRNLDDRPAFTLSMRKKGERFHGLDKFHLNNSVQDETYLNELVASEICREAGYPAPRVTHARVWLNDRDLGFYVLKEGFDELFLKRHFVNWHGNLYDGAFCNDIDAALEKDCGKGPDDMSDLKGLIAACREGDQGKRWALLDERLDVDAFLTYVALETMMAHWDGYSLNRNNYRVYFHDDDKKAMFLPAGMDQMFRDASAPVFIGSGAMVTSAVLQNPAWNEQYRERVRQLLPLFAADKLQDKVDAGLARIRPVVAGISEERARSLEDRVRDFRARLADRQKGIRNQFPPEPISFTPDGWALVEEWEPRAEGDAKLAKQSVDGKPCLSIATGPSNRCVASYRAKVRLAKGKYRFEASVKTDGVVALGDDKGAGGAGVRLSGGTRQNQMDGTTNWQTVSHDFEVGEELREVELVAELRSLGGSTLFDAASLRVVKSQ